MRQDPLAELKAYDAQAIARYYRWRWGAVVGRLLAVVVPLLTFVCSLQLDRWFGQSERNTARRASQLRQLLTRLGPSFVKVGQALSTRPDLIRRDYLEELTQLQDNLAGFPSKLAFARVEQELGRPVDQIFAEITPEPVAAASLGQVHKARLHSGEWVAVKIQRPHLTRLLSLDLYLSRRVRW
ncbi:MAG: AarF/UbiB family protein, partial [Cyanophyceae cyanobacterium]